MAGESRDAVVCPLALSLCFVLVSRAEGDVSSDTDVDEVEEDNLSGDSVEASWLLLLLFLERYWLGLTHSVPDAGVVGVAWFGDRCGEEEVEEGKEE